MSLQPGEEQIAVLREVVAHMSLRRSRFPRARKVVLTAFPLCVQVTCGRTAAGGRLPCSSAGAAPRVHFCSYLVGPGAMGHAVVFTGHSFLGDTAEPREMPGPTRTRFVPCVCCATVADPGPPCVCSSAAPMCPSGLGVSAPLLMLLQAVSGKQAAEPVPRPPNKKLYSKIILGPI